MHPLQPVLVATQRPLVGAQLVIRQHLDRIHILHRRDETPQQVRGALVIRIARHHHIAHPRALPAPGQMLGKGQRTRIGNTHQHLVNVRIDLLQVQHHQIGIVQQRLQHLVVVQRIAVGIQTGMDIVRMTRHEPVTHELVLQQRLPARGRHPAPRGLQIVPVRQHLLHHLGHRHVLRPVALQIPGVAVVTVQAAHQAALQKQHIAQPRPVHRPAGLDGMHMPHALVVAMPGMTSSSRGMRCRSTSRVRPGSAPFQPAGRRIPEHPGSGFPWLQAPDRHAAFATFGGTVCDPVNRHQRNDRMAGSRTYRRLPAIGGAPGGRHLTGSRR